MSGVDPGDFHVAWVSVNNAYDDFQGSRKAGIVDFQGVTREIATRFDEAGLHYALIGGFAIAMRGVQRATVDLDFLLSLDDMERADGILRALGYERMFHSENVSHYRSERPDFGRIDVLHAFRAPSRGMLERAERLVISPGLELPVLRSEDIIGLKVQAAVNDPERAAADWQDIEMLIRAAGHRADRIDWSLVGDYLEVFGQKHRLRDMKSWYGKAD